MTTECVPNIYWPTIAASDAPIQLNNINDFRSFLDAISIPKHAKIPFSAIMGVVFRKRYQFSVFIIRHKTYGEPLSPKMTKGFVYTCRMDLYRRGIHIGEIQFEADIRRRMRKLSYPMRMRVPIIVKGIFIHISSGGFSKRLSYTSNPEKFRKPPRSNAKHKPNHQIRYRRFMTSVISSLLMHISNNATEYVMDQ